MALGIDLDKTMEILPHNLALAYVQLAPLVTEARAYLRSGDLGEARASLDGARAVIDAVAGDLDKQDTPAADKVRFRDYADGLAEYDARRLGYVFEPHVNGDGGDFHPHDAGPLPHSVLDLDVIRWRAEDAGIPFDAMIECADCGARGQASLCHWFVNVPERSVTGPHCGCKERDG